MNQSGRENGEITEPPAYEEAIQEQEAAHRYEESARFLNGSNNNSSNDGFVPNDGGELDDLTDDEDLIVGENELRHEMEQFEIDDGLQHPPQNVYQRASLASQRFAQKFKDHLIFPVQHILIDPVARFWAIANGKLDEFLSKFGNPLAFKRLFYLFCVAMTVFIALMLGVVPSTESNLRFGQQFHNPIAMREFIKSAVSTGLMQDNYNYMTSMAHMAGTTGDFTLAKYVESQLHQYGFDSKRIEFNEEQTFLSFPNTTESSMELNLLGDRSYHANLWEGKMYSHPTDSQQQTRPFSPLSVQGEAEGHLIYANYGTMEDFDFLDSKNIDVNGAIVLVRYGKWSAGLKAVQAEKRGAKGIVFFSEKLTDEMAWPDGPGYPEDAVQRECVAVPAIVPGDILTPGWSSSESSRVINYESTVNIPHIPAVPISWKEVKPFLEALKGHGEKVSKWSNKAPIIDEWWTGESGSDNAPRAFLRNNPVLKERHSIWNVLAKIYGMEQTNLAIIVGAPRDSFCYGGVEPTTGTVVMLEVARVLSYMNRELGWSPLRSVYFASWDGSKQNMVGSTEWVENNIQELRKEGVVYINLNDAISGKNFHAHGHPVFKQVLKKTLDSVADPLDLNSTIGQSWHGDIESMDGQSDYLSFLCHAGIASIDVKFSDDNDDNAFPKHSCFDSAEWMERFADGDFSHHKALVEIVADIIMRYCDDPIIPFDLTNYGEATHRFVRDLEKYARSRPTWKNNRLDFNNLQIGSDALKQGGIMRSEWEQIWLKAVESGGEPLLMGVNRQSWNSRLTSLDKDMLYRGIHDRLWYHHGIFGPQLWYPVEGDYEWFSFPLIRDLIQEQKWDEAQKMIDVIGRTMQNAVMNFVN